MKNVKFSFQSNTFFSLIITLTVFFLLTCQNPMSTFEPINSIKEPVPTVHGVTVIPATVGIGKGGNQSFTAIVSGERSPT